MGEGEGERVLGWKMPFVLIGGTIDIFISLITKYMLFIEHECYQVTTSNST